MQVEPTECMGRLQAACVYGNIRRPGMFLALLLMLGLFLSLSGAALANDEKRAKEAANRPDERPLSSKEMASLRGRGPYRNQYFAGTLPWHRSIRDVNMCNGNLFKSFTDIQMAPAKGAGLAMQRTYNSQEASILAVIEG